MYDFSVHGLGSPFGIPTRKIFVSYHHDLDQAYYDEFSKLFSGTYGVVRDNSVDRLFDSDDVDYVMRRIRENYITGTSCTVVLCGPQTPWRKYIDWEIKATLDKKHGLIGINLPHNPKDAQRNVYIIPDRLYDNIQTGYAIWTSWESLLSDAPYLPQQTLPANWPRLYSQAISPYAYLQRPALQGSAHLKLIVEQAITKSSTFIKNDRLMRQRNG